MRLLLGFVCTISLIVSVGGIWYWYQSTQTQELVTPLIEKITEKPLDKYTIEKMSQRQFSSQIKLDEAVATTSAYTVYRFHFDSDTKRVNGLAHIPNTCNDARKCPVIAQFRGYVDLEIYGPGVGTRRSAEVFAANGFISLAPDFLGYGDSDNPSIDIFEARFETYTTALNLLAAIKEWNYADGDIYLWGHSNGGQIALTVLEISGGDYPTVLWAPVSKPFPYSILYYTDEADDKGKAIRKKLADFEKDYDVFNYDLTRFYDRINAPIQLHQGTGDDAVSYKWSRDLNEALLDLEKDVEYFEYLGGDHNLTPGWNLAVQRSIEFFKTH